MQMADMTNVKVSFGPVYWIHNNSMVPTTTTTTTTSTEPSTTKRKEVFPAMPPPLEDMDDNDIAADQQSQESEIHNVHQQMTPDEVKKASSLAVKDGSSSANVHRISCLLSTVLILSASLALF